MIKSIIAIFFVAASLLPGDQPSIKAVRDLYFKAGENKIACEQLSDILSAVNDKSSALLLGYRASAYILESKYLFNPYSKWKSFQKGNVLLDKTISSESSNIELRFLRFSIQTNVPSFLGYAKNITEDKTIIINGIKNFKEEDLRNRIISFLLKSKYITESEKQKLKL